MVKGIKWSRAAAGAVIEHARTAPGILLLCLGAAAAAPMGAAAGPYSGAPVAIPGTIEAERFNTGGEGVGYHDQTWYNDLGAFRPYEGVDIRNDPRAWGNNFIVSSIEFGEWTAYTINVTQAGWYQWGVSAATPYTGAAFHLELDGWNMTGQVKVPNTGSADNFQWVGAPNVWLNQGWYTLTIMSEGNYFDLDLIVITPASGASSAPAAPAAPSVQTSQLTPTTSGRDLSCMFNNYPECGFVEQAKVAGRASLTSLSRDGGTALRLHTEPGDSNVVYSGAMERDDVYLGKPGTADADVFGEGVEQWWGHSILFPDDFTMPYTQGYVVFDFHNTGPTAQANFHVAFEPGSDDYSAPGVMKFIGNNAYGRYDAVIGRVQKNFWYDFVYHVKWSSGSDGYFYAWVNGQLIMAHTGPTLYPGQGVYMKLANYHQPVCGYFGCGGDLPSSVIHDRVVRGSTAASVALTPLQYY